MRVQATNDETGYNTDTSGRLDNKDGPWTHSLLIADLGIITIGTDQYYEIRLDLNEAQNGAAELITLEELQFSCWRRCEHAPPSSAA